MLVIDTHAHLFSRDEERYPPKPNPTRPPAGKGTIEHLQWEMRKAGVSAVTAVQVGGFYGFDNRYVCDAAKQHPTWIAGICTLDPNDPESPATLKRLIRDYGIRGMRGVPASGGALDHDGVRALWKTAAEEGITVNLLTGAELAAEAERVIQALPNLNVILDHCMKLEYGSDIETTLAALRRLSRLKNVYAKMSFIGNGPHGCRDGYPCREFHQVCLELIEMFGAERCAWGAHFPLEKYSPSLTYSKHLKIYAEELPLKPEARQMILGGTAQKLYFN